jgi:hypothetical protein
MCLCLCKCMLCLCERLCVICAKSLFVQHIPRNCTSLTTVLIAFLTNIFPSTEPISSACRSLLKLTICDLLCHRNATHVAMCLRVWMASSQQMALYCAIMLLISLTTTGEKECAKTAHTTNSSSAVGMKVKMTARYSI